VPWSVVDQGQTRRGLIVIKNGFYEVEFATPQGRGTAKIRHEDGVLQGETDRGTRLDGLCGEDTTRNAVSFEIAAIVPPKRVTVTGLTTGDEPRRIVFRGELPNCAPSSRFSVDFAGRAVDLVARYLGPL
jgi:hypothetical protein